MLADKLGMDKQAAETWVVNLIRNARLNAKIDSKVRCEPDAYAPDTGPCCPVQNHVVL